MKPVVCFYLIIIVLFFISSASSCNIIVKPALKVISWTPGNETPADPADLKVSVVFDRLPDTVRAEEAFSLTSDGTEPPGRFSWDEASLFFTPFSPLDAAAGYEIKVTTGAEDRYGNSLAEDFIVKFRTGAPGKRPSVCSILPSDGSRISNNSASVVIAFDRGIDFDSILRSFSVTPDVPGVSRLSADKKIFTFTPAEKWRWQQEYSVELSTDLRSVTGYKLPEVFLSYFTAGDDELPPTILTAASEDGSLILTASPADSPAIQVNSGWEKDGKIRIVFSEEINRTGAESAITIEPAVQLDISFNDAEYPPELLIGFEENLEWRKLYRLVLSAALKDLQDNSIKEEQIFYLFIDGTASKPPEVSKVIMSPDAGTGFCIFDSDNPATATDSHRILDTSGGDAVQNPYYIDYYLNLAEGAQLPLFEFTENFLISPSDSCVSFTYLDFQLFNPGEAVGSAAVPRPSPETDQAVLRLITSLSDSSTSSGTILLQVFNDIRDSLNNSMEADWTAELFDEDN